MNKFKNILIIVLLIICIISISNLTYSWFNNVKSASVSNSENADLVTTPFLDISKDGKNWNNPYDSGDSSRENYYNNWNHIMYNVSNTIADISSDGETFYYVNNLINEDKIQYDNPDVLKLITSDDIEYKKNVIEMEAYLRTTKSMDVYLGNTQSLKSVVEGQEILGGVNIPTRQSLFCSDSDRFSADGICAAVRVAFYELMDIYLIKNKTDSFKNIEFMVSDAAQVKETYETSNGKTMIVFTDMSKIEVEDYDGCELLTTNKPIEVLKVIWIPNDKYELSYDEAKIAHYNTQGKREKLYRDITDKNDVNYNKTNPYGYLSLNVDHIDLVSFKDEDYLSGKVIVGNNALANVTNGVTNSNGGNAICTFNDSDTPITKHIKIKVWIEGTDREADKALNGGMIKYQFVFVGLDKKDNIEISVEDDITNEILLSDGRKIIYSSYEVTRELDEIDPETQEKKVTIETKWYLHYEGDENPCTDILYSANGIDWLGYTKGFDLTNMNRYFKLKETSSTKQSNIINCKFKTN